MALQFVIRCAHGEVIERALADVIAECELFPLRANHFGLSIPSKVVNAVGESVLRGRLATLNHYDLWSGQWSEGAPSGEPEQARPPAKSGLMGRLFRRDRS